MAKFVCNVVKKKFRFKIVNAELQKEEIEIEAESPSAAVLLLPEGVKNWWLIGENS